MHRFGDYTINIDRVPDHYAIKRGYTIGEAAIRWPGKSLDIYGQYYNVGWAGHRSYPIFSWLQQSVANGRWVGYQGWGEHPGGTITGVYTKYRRGFPGAVEHVPWPPVPMMTDYIYVYAKLLKHEVEAVFSDVTYIRKSVHIKIGILPWLSLDVFDGYWPGIAGFENLEGFVAAMGSFAMATIRYREKLPYSPPLFFCFCWAGEYGTEPDFDSEYDFLKPYKLYHVAKRNAEIAPPHGTTIYKGFPVTIEAYPTKKNAVLTNLLIDTPTPTTPVTEYLPGALVPDFPVDEKGITLSPDLIKKGHAIATVVSNGDMYVSAIADGEEIPGEIPFEIQMTTTDCLVTTGSWKLGETNLPDNVLVSISEDGLVAFRVKNRYFDIVGNEYYQEVIFNGYSQTMVKRLVLTVNDIPAYGTVWTGIHTFAAEPRDVLQASDGTIYISTDNKIYSTTDLVTFTEIALSGVVDTRFGSLGETSEGIVVADKSALWVLTAGVFVRKTTGPTIIYEGYQITTNPSSPIVFQHDASGISAVGRVRGWNIQTDASVGTFTIIDDLNGWVNRKGVLAGGKWYFAGGASSLYNVVAVDIAAGTATEVVPLSSAYGNHNPNFMYDAVGRFYVVGQKTNELFFYRYSEDDGATWSGEVTSPWPTTADGVQATQALIPGFSLIAINNHIYRTIDEFETFTDVAALNGAVNNIIRLANGTLLAVCAGSPNLYKSEA